MSIKRCHQEVGQSLIEYTLLLGLLALALVAGVSLLGDNLGARFALLDSGLAQVAQAIAATPDSPAADDEANPGGADDPADEGNQDDENDQNDNDDDNDEPAKPGKPTKPAKPGKPTKPGKPAKPSFPWLPWLP